MMQVIGSLYGTARWMLTDRYGVLVTALAAMAASGFLYAQKCSEPKRIVQKNRTCPALKGVIAKLDQMLTKDKKLTAKKWHVGDLRVLTKLLEEKRFVDHFHVEETNLWTVATNWVRTQWHADRGVLATLSDLRETLEDLEEQHRIQESWDGRCTMEEACDLQPVTIALRNKAGMIENVPETLNTLRNTCQQLLLECQYSDPRFQYDWWLQRIRWGVLPAIVCYARVILWSVSRYFHPQGFSS